MPGTKCFKLANMLKSITQFLAALGPGKARPAQQFQPTSQLAVRAGDVLAQPDGAAWAALKVIAVDGPTAHYLTYEQSPAKPDLAALAQAEVRMAHAAKPAAALADGWELLGNQPASARELQGLKYMDFALYLQLTGQQQHVIEAAARDHFARAGAMRDEGRSTEAIREYGKAIDLYPLFHEALSQRAYAFMELGLHQQALRDLEEALYLVPDSADAFFSRGECLLKLGHLEEAEAAFSEGQERFPEQRTRFLEFLKRTRAFALTGRPA